MSKEQRDAEIDRICNIAVAQENTRLADGGLGPDDYAGESASIEHESQRYLVPPPDVHMSAPIFGDGTGTLGYLEPTEEPVAEAESSQPIPMERTDIERRINEIRGKVGSYPYDVRVDMGFLLTVIDSWLA